MNVLKKTHPLSSNTKLIYQFHFKKSNLKRVISTKKKKRTLMNILKKTHPPFSDIKTHLLVSFLRGSESPSLRGHSCKKRKENVSKCFQSDNQPHLINLSFKTLSRKTRDPQV